MSSETPIEDGLEPGPVRGAVGVPVSKSLAQRAIVAACFARGRTRLGPLTGIDPVDLERALVERRGTSDVAAAVGFASAWRSECTLTDGWLTIGGARVPRRAGERLAIGESGTLARLVTACIGIADRSGTEVRLEPAGTLVERRSDALFDALSRAGAKIEAHGSGAWPATLRPADQPRSLRLERPSSSQELSGLWMAAAAHGTPLEVLVTGEVPSEPYLGLTEDVLARFGVTFEILEGPGPYDRRVRGPLVAPTDPLELEPDASAAGVALALGCLSGGSTEVVGLGRGSRQGDVRAVEHLRAFGCEAEARDDRLVARGRPTRSARLDLGGEPDLAPVMAAVAGALALSDPRAGTTLLSGLETLPGKESSRIAVLAEGLAALGLRVEGTDGSLAIGPGAGSGSALEPVLLDPHGDHRMAFAFGLLGLVRPGVRISDPDCVAKSWPGFFDAVRRVQRAPGAG